MLNWSRLATVEGGTGTKKETTKTTRGLLTCDDNIDGVYPTGLPHRHRRVELRQTSDVASFFANNMMATSKDHVGHKMRSMPLQEALAIIQDDVGEYV